jgi:hypothetical protein
MVSKPLSATTPPNTIEQLRPIAKVLRRARKRENTSTPDISEATVYGVRDAKRRLSTLLNEASSGEVTFIEAGQGGTVVLIGTDTLADLFAAIEESRDLTFEAAIAALPYRPSELSPLLLEGHAPVRGVAQRLADTPDT